MLLLAWYPFFSKTLTLTCAVDPRLAGTAAGDSTVRRLSWDSKLGRNRSAAAITRGAGRFQNLFNAMFDFAFTSQAAMDRGDLALAVDYKRRGQRVHSAIKLRRAVIADHDAVIDAQFGDERLH